MDLGEPSLLEHQTWIVFMPFKRLSKLLVILFLFHFSPYTFADVIFEKNQFEVSTPPQCNHVPLHIPFTATSNVNSITVSSDTNWAIPSVNTELNQIEINFDTSSLFASYTSTITVSDGVKDTEIYISSNVSPLDIYRLVDDPLRSKTYGIHRNGIKEGSLVAYDPVNAEMLSCLTLGKGPTDFVINNNSTELLVINSVSKSISVIDLVDFSLSETIALPSYDSWGDEEDTTANIDLGANDIIYYSDGSWGPVLHVLKRSTNEVLQSIIFHGTSPSNGTGFMDFSVTKDKSRMIAMPQYGWSAGSHSANIGQFSINDDGTVNFDKQTQLTNFIREPFEAPVLIRDDDQVAVLKTIAVSTNDTDELKKTFSSAIWSMNSNASLVATENKIYDYDTGNELYSFSSGGSPSGYIGTKAQAFTSDFTRFVYFNNATRTINVVDLVEEIGLEELGRSLAPGNKSVVNSPEELTWTTISGVDQYDVYLGTSEDSINSADTSSNIYLGRVSGSSLALTQTLENGVEYFWRVDPVTLQGSEKGVVLSFIVSDIQLDITAINAQTVIGHSNHLTQIQLESEESGKAWTVSSSESWIDFEVNSGTTPATLKIVIDASQLEAGFYSSEFSISLDSGEIKVPVSLEVVALNLTHIVNDKNSSKAYLISENTSDAISKAYLLETDTETEKILRVVSIGSSVSDIAIHYPDDLIYITNWKSGSLLELNKTTLEQIKTHAFQPAGATGYSEGDVYRVAAGFSQRIIVEEEDQWVDINLYNTATETELDSVGVREGGGQFDPSGRYYYHGENDSSGASIIKFDTSGDVFTQLVESRPDEISSYYGSRTVVVSEDGSRVFWAGAVFDAELEPEWGTEALIYSASTDGRYAFGENAIYDVNLKRQIFSMPAQTSVSGYNSTSAKLVVQSNGGVGYFDLSSDYTAITPDLTIKSSSDSTIQLSWTDKTLENAFIIQQRLLGSQVWEDVVITDANAIEAEVHGLTVGSSYEFRVRASYDGNSSQWSNTVVKQEDDVIEALSRFLSPIDNGIVAVPEKLSWMDIPWISEYDLYLGTDEYSVSNATQSSDVYLGRVDKNTINLANLLSAGTEYFWRIDPVIEEETETGYVFSFIVSDIGLDIAKIDAQTFAGHQDYKVSVELSSVQGGEAWSVSSTSDWITFELSSGMTPATLDVYLDASKLAIGDHNSSFTLNSANGAATIPVFFHVEPLNITHLESDRNSSSVFAISEAASSDNTTAFLLELDTSTEEIIRVVDVGSSVTDIAIHYEDDLIYVTNWNDGLLYAFDISSFELVKTHEFEPVGQSGYGEGDVYSIAAGASERLIIEEEDQWIDINLYNTTNDSALSTSFVREGGGEFGPNGRYYYHGENNSSGASIIKFDTSGDVLTNTQEVRPEEISSSYGSRKVVVSEDGTHIFWAGVALDESLNTVWGVGEVIYSASEDGRYAISSSSVYDITLKRKVYTLPTTTQFSAYNSTSRKIVLPVNGALDYFSFEDLPSALKPLLAVSDIADTYIELYWNDGGVNEVFLLQVREINTEEWTNLATTEAGATHLTVSDLTPDSNYEFRIRPTSTEDEAHWSNVKSVTTALEATNLVPTPFDDDIILLSLAENQFNILENDSIPSELKDEIQIYITRYPQFGSINWQVNGEFVYTPYNNFDGQDSFEYLIFDHSGNTSSEATVTVTLAPSPVLTVSGLDANSVKLSWSYTGDESSFVIQQRELETENWINIQVLEANSTFSTVDNLTELTSYEFRIRASKSENNELWSNVVIVTTQEGSEINSSSGGSINLLYLILVLLILGFKRYNAVPVSSRT